MTKSNDVMSQEAIDSMLLGGGPSAAPAPPPVAPRQAASGDGPGKAVDRSLASLQDRLGRLEESVQRIAEAQLGLTRTVEAASEDATLRGDLERLYATVEALLVAFQNTLGADVHHTFTCAACGHHGTLATPVTCTSCGTQTWWGWWPPKPSQGR